MVFNHSVMRDPSLSGSATTPMHAVEVSLPTPSCTMLPMIQSIMLIMAAIMASCLGGGFELQAQHSGVARVEGWFVKDP